MIRIGMRKFQCWNLFGSQKAGEIHKIPLRGVWLF